MTELMHEMMNALDNQKCIAHIEWLTHNTPDRMSGRGQDRIAAEYIVDKMTEYGLEAKILDFETYNSHPIRSSLRVTAPVNLEMDSRPCCHIQSTPSGGCDYELVYMGSGGEENYVGKDVTGKAILVEVSYAPATPEKAMIAAEHGVAAMICMNWGTPDQELICGRGLKAVWGNPTTESFQQIPQLAGISITRKDGETLKKLCQENETVIVHLEAEATRHWQILPQPMGILRGTEEPEKFLLVTAHLDAWNPGVTCNATGDGTMLELARVFGQFKDKIKRSIYFVYWNGHEIAEAAGSTWFQDYFFEDIERNCIGYINIDSTGMKGAEQYGADASRELSDFAYKVIQEAIGEDINVNYLCKTGDQSFFGVGVPSIAGRVSYTPEVIEKYNGATLGYWNHTVEDTLDKMDPVNLEKDNRVDTCVLLGLVNAPVLPYDFRKTCEDMAQKVAYIKAESGNLIDLNKIKASIASLTANVSRLNAVKEQAEEGKLRAERVKELNHVLMRLSRFITNAFYTYSDKYNQDSYGRTILAKPLPLLYPVIELSKMDPHSLEYKLKYTNMLRNRNRVADAVNMANDVVELFLSN